MTSPKEHVVLVTGGAGFLGQHIIGLLQTRAQHVTEIRVIDLPSNPYINKLGHDAAKPVQQFLGSITDADLLRRACQGVHCVMHIAGVIDVSMFPDIERLERVNVKGTSLLLEVCKEVGVRHFLYCSTMDVVLGKDDIINGTEQSTHVPDVFFFNGYASTKQKAEEIVLAANQDSFRTISLRPLTMYGEEDGFTVTEPLKMARKFRRWSRMDCKDSRHQLAYVGNVAWAFVTAEKNMLKDKENELGGNAFFVTDDTPIMDLFELMAPFAMACGFSTDTLKMPVLPVVCVMYIVYMIMWLVSFVVPVNLRTGISSFKFMRKTFTFSGDKAKSMLGYRPLYSYMESINKSTYYYSKQFNR